MKRNDAVIDAFFYGIEASNRNLQAGPKRLINYRTFIVERYMGYFVMNMTKYSSTTTRIQNYVLAKLKTFPKGENGIIIITGVPVNTITLASHKPSFVAVEKHISEARAQQK